MADFNTHVLVAAGTTSFAATICTKLLALPISTALLLTVAGTLGGVLPDIDLKYSMPSKLLFSLLGAITSLTWLFANLDVYTVLELWLFAMMLFLIVRYPVWALFHQFTVHRGALHSLSAMIMFSFLAAVAAHHVLHLQAATSWLLALFVAAGVFIHLLLDEIYSVDFMGVRIKHSFGSALKPIDMDRLAASCAVLFVCLVSWFWTPPLSAVMDIINNNASTNWRALLLPTWLG